MIKDVFSYANITLTGTNGGVVIVKPTTILAMQELDGCTELYITLNGCMFPIKVRQTPGRIKQKINNLAAKQRLQQKEMEEQARIEAQDNFFDKYPKTKEVFKKEVEEMANV